MFGDFGKMNGQACGKKKAFSLLHLKMDMRLACISAVAAAGKELTAADVFSDTDTKAVFLYVCDGALFVPGMSEYNVISAHIGSAAYSLDLFRERSIVKAIFDFDNSSVGGSQYGLLVAEIIGHVFAVAVKGPAVFLNIKIIGVSLAADTPGMRGFPCDSAVGYRPAAFKRKLVQNFRLIVLDVRQTEKIPKINEWDSQKYADILEQKF